jgi:hypothetical protein
VSSRCYCGITGRQRGPLTQSWTTHPARRKTSAIAAIRSCRSADIRSPRHTQLVTNCLACGFGIAVQALWVDEAASDEICPCCGLHFGYDDAGAGRGDPRSEFYDGWRARWIMDGYPWFSTATLPPEGWSGPEQVATRALR